MKWSQWQKAADKQTLWVNHHEKGLLKAEHIKEYTLQLWFEELLDVTIYELDFYPLLFEDEPGPAFIPLQQVERFKQVYGQYALIWPNPENGAYDEQAIDLAPECVRFFCERYGRVLKASHVGVH